MASRRSAQTLGAETLYCCKDGWYVEDVDSGDELHLTSNALSLSAMRQAAGIGRYGSWPKPLLVPLPVQNLVRRLSATPGETAGSQEPWPRLSDYGADFDNCLHHSSPPARRATPHCTPSQHVRASMHWANDWKIVCWIPTRDICSGQIRKELCIILLSLSTPPSPKD